MLALFACLRMPLYDYLIRGHVTITPPPQHFVTGGGVSVMFETYHTSFRICVIRLVDAKAVGTVGKVSHYLTCSGNAGVDIGFGSLCTHFLGSKEHTSGE